jgi:hypothetical protein
LITPSSDAVGCALPARPDELDGDLDIVRAVPLG